ncbi:MAG TPA: radical SAM protein [Gemmatimonadales bacterium]|nr:radical SAM protein [Gemmatimonadales bacterium]
MKQRVVLYNPTADFHTMPLALLAIGSHLDRQRFEPIIIDGRLERDPIGRVLQEVGEALCFGVTVLSGQPIRDAVRVSRAVKARHPELPVVWGGWHPSMFGKDCLEEPSIDVTVQAQGEVTFSEIVDRLAGKNTLDGCAGCTYRGGDSVVDNGARPLADVNTLEPHDYSLIDVQRYYALKGKRQLDYITSQGCRFRCAFCADPFVYQRRWVGLEPARVGAEIAELWQRYGFQDVNFQDETFFTSTPRVVAIAEEFLGRKVPITWAATMRADQCSRLPDDALAICKRSGLRRVLVGVESGSPDMLKRIRKDVTIEQVLETAERCLKAGIRVRFPFIVGFPDEDEESVSATLALIKHLRTMSADFETQIFYFKPYPGTSITQQAVARGYQLPRTLAEWSDFDFVGSRGPWVSDAKYRRVERFKFYQRLAWDRAPGWKRPLQALARWRCRNDVYGLPVEKLVLRNRPALA